MQVLWNQTLTKCKFCKPFVLIIIHLMGGVCIPLSFLFGTVHVGPGTGWSRHGRRVRLSLWFSSRVGICRGRSILSQIGFLARNWLGHSSHRTSLWFFTENRKLPTENYGMVRYRSSRISFSLPADKSSIFLVSACEIFSISSSARFCSSWLIFFSFSILSIASLTSRRMLRTAVR